MATFTITTIVKVQIEARDEDHARELYHFMSAREVAANTICEEIDNVEEG